MDGISKLLVLISEFVQKVGYGFLDLTQTL